MKKEVGSKERSPKTVEIVKPESGGVPSVKLASAISVPRERQGAMPGQPNPYVFEIQGLRPNQVPLPRLMEYLKDVGILLGHAENIHLVGIDDRSTAPILLVDQQFEKRAQKRMLGVRTKHAPKEAMRAFESINARLAEDNTSGRLIDPTGLSVIPFPGKVANPEPMIGPVEEPGTLQGELIQIGGRDETISLYVRDEAETFICTTSRANGKKWGKNVFSAVRIFGTGTWFRLESGKWKLHYFWADKLERLSFGEDLRGVVSKLHAMNKGVDTAMLDAAIDGRYPT